jgi:hypothetical protein
MNMVLYLRLTNSGTDMFAVMPERVVWLSGVFAGMETRYMILWGTSHWNSLASGFMHACMEAK